MDFYAGRRAGESLALGVNDELACDQAAGHDDTGAKTVQQQALGAQLAGKGEHAGGDTLGPVPGTFVTSESIAHCGTGR